MMFLSFSILIFLFFFFKQKTAYEMRISDWSSDVCSSDLPAPDEAGEHLGQIARQPERLAHFGHCAAGTVACDHRRQCRAVPPVGLIDPLDDFLAPLMFEVDVDIGRLLALTRHETLEEQFMLDRVDRSDAHEEADAAVPIGRASCREKVCKSG